MASPTAFTTRVLAIVRRIPAGRVATYGDVAEAAGQPGAARAVGTIMRNCREPGVPCHRVVAAGGRLGGFGSSPQLKRSLLAAEGVRVVGRSIRQFADVRWTGWGRRSAGRRRTAAGRGT
jgi:O-6-methylguanine DNA methyltransferase